MSDSLLGEEDWARK